MYVRIIAESKFNTDEEFEITTSDIIAEKLKSMYRDQNKISWLFENIQMPLEEAFVKVAVIKDEEKKEKEKEVMDPTIAQSNMDTYESIYKPKCPVELDKLLDLTQASPTNHLLIE